MSQTVQRQTNQMPAWLMSPGAVVGIVGAILKKHAEKIRELIGLQRRPPQIARRAALTGRTASSQRWERATDWPLMVAAVVFLAAYAVPILATRTCRDGCSTCVGGWAGSPGGSL